MKISVLCVTHERPEFIPWLLWNYERLDWKDKELVIIDSSETATSKKGKGIVCHHAPGANVPTKRNMAIDKATGDLVTWLDDDDWRHPDSLKILSGLVCEPESVAGGRVASFVNLATEETRRFVQRKGILFANMLAETAVAREFAFDESLERGSDIDWLTRLTNGYSYGFTYEAPSMFLCHDRNMGNRADAHYFNRPLVDFQDMVSKRAWGDTAVQLKELRKRLGN